MRARVAVPLPFADPNDAELREREVAVAAAVENLSKELDLSEEEIARRFIEARPSVNTDDAAFRLVRFHREAELAGTLQYGVTRKPIAEVLEKGVLRVEATGPGSPLLPEDVERPVSYEPSPEVEAMVREGAMRYHLDGLKALAEETPEGFALALEASDPAKLAAARSDRSDLGAARFVERSNGPNRRQRRASKRR